MSDEDDDYIIPLYRYVEGCLPLVINVPHSGAYLPPLIEEQMSEAGKAVRDTDWHVDQLYQFAAGEEGMGAHMLTATHARYVVDLNRDPEGKELYPGQFNSSLCPMLTFNKEPIYQKGQEPSALDTEARISEYWQPYHSRLNQLLTSLHKEYGKVILLDAHSIRTQVPVLFDGELPAINLGTDGGRTLPTELEQQVADICERSRFSSILNGRFKGGYNTRHYAQPDKGIYALQIELAQQHYMEEDFPHQYMELRAAKLQKTLGDIINTLIAWTKT